MASSAAMTATATKRTRSRKVSRGSRFVSNTATATIGPNSPMAPTDRTDGPIACCSTPASRKIGSRVPSAVVVRHSATTTRVENETGGVEHEPDDQRDDKRDPPGSNGASQVPTAHRRQVELRAGQEHQIGQSEVGQRGDDVVRVHEIEHKRPEHDAEEDLDHDLGYGTERRSPSAMIGASTAARR